MHSFKRMRFIFINMEKCPRYSDKCVGSTKHNNMHNIIMACVHVCFLKSRYNILMFAYARKISGSINSHPWE